MQVSGLFSGATEAAGDNSNLIETGDREHIMQVCVSSGDISKQLPKTAGDCKTKSPNAAGLYSKGFNRHIASNGKKTILNEAKPYILTNLGSGCW